jgi:signal transduction histidine kinase
VTTLINLKIAKFVLLKQKLEMESAAELNRTKDEFLANMSHELRTPLNAIIGFSEIMYCEKMGVLSPVYKEFLKDILTSSKHLLHLINEMLDLTKIEAGKMEFHYETINMSGLLNEIKDTFLILAAEKHITLSMHLDPTLVYIVLDPERLKGIFYNYISNALKFTLDGGQVSISVFVDINHTFRLEVKDTGVGIHKKDLNRLFIEFQQLDNTISKKYQGTGLGLALTKHIVEALGGRVGVSSILGKGSIFYAVLPYIEPSNK